MTTASMIAVESYRMTRSALPTGPCGSSTPSLHDAINSAVLVIDIARSHMAGILWKSNALPNPPNGGLIDSGRQDPAFAQKIGSHDGSTCWHVSRPRGSGPQPAGSA